MTIRCLEVTGGGSVGKCGRLSQPSWLLVRTIIIQWSAIIVLTYLFTHDGWCGLLTGGVQTFSPLSGAVYSCTYQEVYSSQVWPWVRPQGQSRDFTFENYRLHWKLYGHDV